MAVQYAFGKIVTQGLDLALDAADPTSYPGSGNTWTSVVNRSITGSLVSCSFSSDFKGGIVFANPTASVQLPGTVANYGTGSFTIEMAFRPTQIQGIHYLVSKNSGSFPNWGVYLSGSGGSGKLFAEYRISSTVSCSVSSSATFVTGSNYFVDTVFDALGRRTFINVDGGYDAISVVANGSGSLTTTASLFVGNLVASSSQPFSGSIFNIKAYSTFTSGYTNFKFISPRINKPIPSRASTALALIVAGGGGGGTANNAPGGGGGGGAGGLILTPLSLTPGTYSVFVGAGGVGGVSGGTIGQNGQTSSLFNNVAIGGGRGSRGEVAGYAAGNGGSGGGGGASFPTPGTGSIGQGFSGGTAPNGGGGGALEPATTINGASGVFISLFSTIGGSPAGWFAGGGGAGSYGTPGVGGFGGGGRGGLRNFYSPDNGILNTGGGGGSGGDNQGGAAGGSGIVIISYPGPPIATGGTITSVGGDTIHTFTATGSSTFTVF
jgi:hypothetical protein